MCEYVNLTDKKCRLTNEICPYVYYCERTRSNKPSKNMPVNCKVKIQTEIPKGAYQVAFERKGKLYVNVKNNIVIVDNPFDYVPMFVKMNKTGGKWRIRK